MVSRYSAYDAIGVHLQFVLSPLNIRWSLRDLYLSPRNCSTKIVALITRRRTIARNIEQTKTDIETGATVIVGGLRSLARSIWIPFYTVSRWTTSFSTIPFQDRKKSVLILFYDRWNIVCSDQALDDPFEQSFCSIAERLYWPIQFPIVEWSSSTIPFEDRWMIVSSTDHFLRSLKDRIYQTLCLLWSLHDPNH